VTKIVVDPEMLAKLRGLAEPIVFCDQQGHVLGHFAPEDDLEPGISLDELRHRSETFQGRPVSDLLAEWEKEG
jgi:hypothetical protein